MAKVGTAWGIDIGQCALKALKLRQAEGELRVEAFDVIEHPRILTAPDADRDQLIRDSLDQFLSRNSLSGAKVVIAAPGQSGFTRFVKLPPVESKQIPQLVRFEAEQQIPFNINEVIWRWQEFKDPDSPDVEVGIFAMKRTDVSGVLDRFAEVGITVDVVQMAPLALYNFMKFDAQADAEGATLLVDIGADKTDLVVADGPRIWSRSLQLGGNNFTEALVKAFKLKFPQAEKLKRSAHTSKYARQIFQAMRPVFAELVQEIQRSIGYYTSLHRESRFNRVLGLGGGFRLPGLQKFLEQNLGIAVVRVDAFNKLPNTAVANAPAFTENVLSFGMAYGLALQGLGQTRIITNLLPDEVARRRLWARKRPWFAGAAAALILTFAGVTYSAYKERAALEPDRSTALPEVGKTVREFSELKKQFFAVKDQDKGELEKIAQYGDMLSLRNLWPELHDLISSSVGIVAKDQLRLNPRDLPALMKVERNKRQVVNVDVLSCRWYEDISFIKDEKTLGDQYQGALAAAGSAYGGGAGLGGAAPPGVGGAGLPAAAALPQRGLCLFMEGSTPLQGTEASIFLNNLKEAVVRRGAAPATDTRAAAAVDAAATVARAMGERLGRPFEVKLGRVRAITPGRGTTALGGGGGGGAPGMPDGAYGDGSTPPITHSNAPQGSLDPLTREDNGNDSRFVLCWCIALKDDPSAGTTGGAK